jgi:diguanylate cyclase (GGDEF)-like protein
MGLVATARFTQSISRALWVVLCFFALWTATPVSASPSVIDAASLENDPLWLRPYSRVLREPPDSPPLAPLQALREPHPWAPVRDGDPIFQFGFDRQAWWAHAVLVNTGDKPVTRVVEVAEPLIDWVDLWAIDRASGGTVASVHTGDRRPFDTRTYAYRHPVLMVTVTPGQTVDLLVRVQALDGGLQPLPWRLWTPPAFARAALTETLLYGAYYGAILVLLLYNGLVYLGTRERSFGWYALFLGCVLVWNLTYRGFALQYFWPQAVTWNHVALVVFSAGIWASMAAFSWSLLDIRRYTPRLYGVQALLAAAALAYAAWIAWRPEATVLGTLDVISLGMFLTLFASAIRIAWQGERVAWIYIAALAALFGGAAVYYLTRHDLLYTTPLALHAVNVGSVVEFLLLAFALAYRINRLKRERDAARHALLEETQAAADRLERQVASRTAELTEANERLHSLAQHDALTGLRNRRSFDQDLANELARTHRGGLPVGFLLLDLDRFKRLNDLGGHVKGDETLRQLGSVLLDQMQRQSDQVYRIGGEEFAVLLPHCSEDAARQIAERLRAAVEREHWPHPDPESRWVTISIGVTLSAIGDTPETLYERADRALYEAKRGGRNRWAWQQPTEADSSAPV